MAKIEKTVGVYERPEKKASAWTVGAIVIVVVLAVAIVVWFL